MPRLLSSYRPQRFQASQRIRGLYLTADARYLLAATAASYSANVLELFDLHTGALLDSQAMPLEFDSEFGLRPDPETAGYVALGKPEYGVYRPVRVSTEGGQLRFTETSVEFSTEGWFTHVALAGGLAYIGIMEGLQMRAADNTIVREIAHPYPDDGNNAIVLSANGQRVAFGNWETQEIRLCHTADGQVLHTLATLGIGNGGGVHMYFPPDGTQFITASAQDVEFWDLATGERRRLLHAAGLDAEIISLSLSPNGRYLALAHTGLALSVYDIEANKQLWRDEDLVDFYACCFGPDNETLFVSSGSRLTRYATQTGRSLENA